MFSVMEIQKRNNTKPNYTILKMGILSMTAIKFIKIENNFQLRKIKIQNYFIMICLRRIYMFNIYK